MPVIMKLIHYLYNEDVLSAVGVNYMYFTGVWLQQVPPYASCNEADTLSL